MCGCFSRCVPRYFTSLMLRTLVEANGHRSPASATTEHRRHEAFESGNPRDAYSSVSHLKGNLDSLSFAIGLREEGGQEGALERLLPMLKIQPRPAGQVRGKKRDGSGARARGGGDFGRWQSLIGTHDVLYMPARWQMPNHKHRIKACASAPTPVS